MRKRRTVVGALAALSAVAIAGPAPGARGAARSWPVSIRTLDAPAPSGYHVYRTASAWRAGQARSGQQGQMDRSGRDWSAQPRVNWSREMVIAAGMGQRPTAGYSVRITSVQRVGDEIVVTVRQATPPRDALVAQVITYPSHTVAVKRMAGPVVFVVNGRRIRSGSAAAMSPDSRGSAGATRPRGDTANTSGDPSLAKSLFILQESGGIAGMNRQTIVHLYGRPVRPSEVMPDARESREAKVGGPIIRIVEKTVRDSGFMSLDHRYPAPRPIADGMTRTIRVQSGGLVKTVTVEDGATAPQAFEDAWNAIQTAINSRGTTVTPWGTRG